MGAIIGIDLGTTNSAISYVENSQYKIILNNGKKTTPSVVYFDKSGNAFVGENAKKRIQINPDRVIFEIKRKMGTDEIIKIDEEYYKPEEISAIILKHLKDVATKHLGQEVDRAIITVPSNFNNSQREATKIAAKIAGLEVERLLNEPTAAAIAYGLDNMHIKGNILVYDLGGGTFDVTILEANNGNFIVKSSEGDMNIGGEDFDKILSKYIIDEVENNTGIDLLNNKFAVKQIKKIAEEAKKNLAHSENEEIATILSGVFDEFSMPISIDMNISREIFNEKIKDLVNKTESTIDRALAAANVTDDDINVVIPVGGSTKINLVREMLKNRFGEKLRFDINPDEVVAIGAGIQAGIINGDFNKEIAPTMQDVCPYTLGTSIVKYEEGEGWIDGIYDPLIHKNMLIPASVKKVYVTIEDNQEGVTVDAYQGTSVYTYENKLIGDVDLNGLTPLPAGEEKVEIEFTYDLDGTLEVKARSLTSNSKVNIKLKCQDVMSEDEIEYAISRINK